MGWNKIITQAIEKKEEERWKIEEESKCRTCWEGIEDEKHFLVECEGYESLRGRYKNKIRNIEKTAKNKIDDNDDEEEEDKWLKIFLGQSNNNNILEQVIEYVKRITADRDKYQKEKVFKKIKKREIYV